MQVQWETCGERDREIKEGEWDLKKLKEYVETTTTYNHYTLHCINPSCNKRIKMEDIFAKCIPIYL